jgi:hypothetical protein
MQVTDFGEYTTRVVSFAILAAGVASAASGRSALVLNVPKLIAQ